MQSIFVAQIRQRLTKAAYLLHSGADMQYSFVYSVSVLLKTLPHQSPVEAHEYYITEGQAPAKLKRKIGRNKKENDSSNQGGSKMLAILQWLNF